jgi:hypothetical protein
VLNARSDGGAHTQPGRNRETINFNQLAGWRTIQPLSFGQFTFDFGTDAMTVEVEFLERSLQDSEWQLKSSR